MSLSVKSVGASPRPESSSPGRGLAHISEKTTNGMLLLSAHRSAR